MKILCDENMPGSLANELRAAGLDAVDVRERNLRGANDDHVLSLALSEGRILVTMDLRRFGNLIATPPASTPGLVVVRMPSSGIRALVDRVVQFLANAREERLLGALTIVEASRTRRRT
ncbi:MAG: DUF5615 family PIN-like protein [Myxococcales bacterium]